MAPRPALLAISLTLAALPAKAHAPPDSPVRLDERQLAGLADRLENRTIRVWGPQGGYQLRCSGIDSAGIAFDPATQRAVAPAGPVAVPPLVSPIEWRRIDGIQTYRSRVLIGSLLGLAAGAALVTHARDLRSGAGRFFNSSAAAACAGLGAGGGALASGWSTVWPTDRAARRAARPAADSARAPPGAVPLAVVAPDARSPHGALAIGLAATLGPAVLATAFNGPGSESAFAWEASLALAAKAGILFGPAIGLSSGGRGDLAKKGVLVRLLWTGVETAGLFAVGAAFASEDGGGGTAALMLGGVAAGGLEAWSCVHDLAITPGAVAEGRKPRALPPPPGPRTTYDDLNDRVGRLPVRVWVGEARYRIEHVRFDSTGVVFRDNDLLPQASGPRGEEYWPAPLRSPIPWQRIDRIEVSPERSFARWPEIWRRPATRE